VNENVQLRCEMCEAPAVCLTVDGEADGSARFACGDCCGCGQCSNVHDAENPYCEAETGGCWRLVAVSAYVTDLIARERSLDETLSDRINDLTLKFTDAEDRLKRAAAEVRSFENVAISNGVHEGECHNGMSRCKRCESGETRLKEARARILVILAGGTP
jgi:hypothetical protein